MKAGDIVIFIKRPKLTPFAEVELIDVVKKPFGNLTKEDKEGHERFESSEIMYQTYSKYYNKTVTADTSVRVIKFKVLKFIKG